MWPFYEKVTELGIPIDVHVTGDPLGLDAMVSGYGLYFTLAREIDMCIATMRVCLGGVLEDFPDLVMIMNHFGGGVSSMIERVDEYVGISGSATMDSFYLGKPRITKPWREYFDKLYFNLAGRVVGMAAVKCALTNISPKRLVFGTDWPFNYDYKPEEVKRYVGEIRKLDLPPGAAEDMLSGNAKRILGF
jgi:predicted TIM-barrel fold metal-dependent hydrolase